MGILMYGSIFEAILENIKLSEEEFMHAINSIAPELFTPIMEEYKNLRPGDIKLIILFIGHAYSKQSSVLVVSDGPEKKIKIANAIDLPDHLHGDLVLLKDSTLRKIVFNYLVQQQDRKFSHLMRKKMMYDAMCEVQADDIRDSDGKIDFKLTIETSKMLDGMLKEIEDLESVYEKEYKFVELNIEELKKIDSHQVTSLTIEHHKLVR